VGAHLRDALLAIGQVEQLIQGEVAGLDETLDFGTTTTIGDGETRGLDALIL
jgi:hypothetical protein